MSQWRTERQDLHPGKQPQWCKQQPLDTVTVRRTPPPDVYHYTYDANGNLIQENTERHFTWDTPTA